MKRILLTIVCTGVLLSALSAQTVTAYNNFGPQNGGWDYLPNFGWSVAGPFVSPPQFGIEQAMGFSPASSGVVTDIWVALFYMPNDPQPDEVTIMLATDPAGTPPYIQNVMERWTISDFPVSGQWRMPQHLAGKGTSYLEKGKSYWLWAEGGPTTWCAWSMNSEWKLTCPHTYRMEGCGWEPIEKNTASAFRVDVNSDFGLAADATTLSESAGGTITFHLCAGSANGQRPYLLLAGASGTVPGLPLPGGSATLPLNFDLLTRFVFDRKNTPAFLDFAGSLASDGSGRAVMTVNPLPPGFAGRTLHFAYALAAPWDYASNPVAIEIVP